MANRPHVILVGLPGAGKTTVGRHLSTKLNCPFIDFDEYIERKIGKSVSRIFTEDGEPAFRAAETALSRALASAREYVLSPGGGWISNRDAVAHLRSVSRIIYLRVSPEEALQRLGDAVAKRPLLAAGDPTEKLRLLYNVRRALYEEAADAILETGQLGREALLHAAVELVTSVWNLNFDS